MLQASKYLVVLVVSLLQTPNIHMQFGNASSATDPFAADMVKMQWCGAGKVPPEIFTHTEGIITEVKRNFSVTLQPLRKDFCPTGIEKSTLVLDAYFNKSKKNRPPAEFASNGYLLTGNYYVPPEGYCITEWSSFNVTVQVCGEYSGENPHATNDWSYPTCGVSNACLPKCCRMSTLLTITAMNKSKTTCAEPFENSETLFNPVLYTTSSKKSSLNTSKYYFRNSKNMKCSKVEMIHQNKATNQFYTAQAKSCFRIREDGVLLSLDEKMNWNEISMKYYCLDGIQLRGMDGSLPLDKFMGQEGHFGALICMDALPSLDTRVDTVYFKLYGSAFFISSCFLLLTFGVYVLLWKEQKIQGWTTMSHTATMFFMYIFLASNNFLELETKSMGSEDKSAACRLSAILFHFFFLSNFCWLTVISFSLFWTFRAISTSSPHSKNIGQYIAYASFGWGLPFVFVLISVILDGIYRDKPCNEFVVPLYGRYSCQLCKTALGPYVYYPIAALLIMNVIFFSITSYKLYSYKKSTAMARQNLDKSKEIRELFQLFAKLFFVMGFTWILEFVSWAASDNKLTWYWAVCDVINIFQGIAIFVIYICKGNILSALTKRYPELKHICGRRSAGIREAETSCTNMTSYSVSDKNNTVRLKQIKQSFANEKSEI